ncbi:hypothetical protein AHMF7616_05014 [Adhaeribacter pallidiroseus]|uniref:Secretion system C-terminal sorting domain-containing protein n=1 Tax=Adhaeribacter pallidiroseus TaxID=2072847 RepID=A0A369QNB3_9BACT|nr:hypothetical protein AHMF7616_05014 [Adhaeribacter pallidiroseus]
MIPSSDGHPIRLVDYNNDGWTDVFILRKYTSSYIGNGELYKNQGVDANGLPVFILVKGDFPSVNINDCEWADVDHDGDQDFYLGTTPFGIYLNEGNDSFSEYIPPFVYYDQNQGRLFDFDNDGDLDIYLRGPYASTEGRAIVLINQIIVGPSSLPNQAPQPPTNLLAVQDEKGMHLSWKAATDDLTPSAGLTYDVVLYRNGKAITKAFLDPFTGNRQKLAPGRALSKLTLKNLPVGAYTWKVQTVDAAYRGSAFSMVGDFFFKPEAPLINDTLIYRCGREITLKAIGEKIEWFKDQKLTIKLASGTFQPRVTQVVYVTQTKNNVQSVANKVTITILERPEKPVLDANNRYTYCNPYTGMTLILQAAGENLKWYSDKELQQPINSGTWISVPAEEKKYFVTQTIQNCESLPVEINVGPTPFDARIFQKQDTLFTAEKYGLYYYWYLNRQALPYENKSFLKTKTPGTYKVFIYKDGCYFQSEEFVFTSSQSRVLKEVQVYPNPSSGDVFVKFPKQVSSVEIKVTDALGSQVYQTYQQKSTAALLQVPAKQWKKGFYFLHLMSGQEKVIVKVILK